MYLVNSGWDRCSLHWPNVGQWKKNRSSFLSLSGEGLRVWKTGLQITGDVFTHLFSYLITQGVESTGMWQGAAVGPVLRPLRPAEALGCSRSLGPVQLALKSREGFGQGEETALAIVELGQPAEMQTG